ncbi:uncharacterized protein LOC127713000 isoform X2 [Mytilus californianus]|uniref:uncharacterized protein LOC127713000 isoform X2 n=1 Tax=Mytilus californianus TaxID=6549 RepID=UPI002245C4DA|nr:uncharacterized protein LOC127713000 isoform X2 [Mytilus californianus]
MDLDNSDDDSVVTNSTFNDPSTELVPSLQHHLKDEADIVKLLPAEICSPIIPIATTVLRNIKCNSQKSVEEDDASDASSVSQSLLTTNNRSKALNFSVIPFSEKVDEWKEILVDRRKNLKENKVTESSLSDDGCIREIADTNDPLDDNIPHSDGKKIKLISQKSHGGGSVSLISHSTVGAHSPDRVTSSIGIITESQETCLPGLKQCEVNHFQENKVPSQSTSSISSLGDINDSNDNNYKKKEEDILCKVEKMQNKIQKKLSCVSARTSAQDTDVIQQKLHAIKSMLIRIAERHKVERNKITIDIKRSGKLKSEKIALKHSLQELSVRQESLFKLFQKHKEITRLMKKDTNLKESFPVVPNTADEQCREKVKMVGGLNTNITKSIENVTSMKVAATSNRTGNKKFVEEQNFNHSAQKSWNDRGSINIEPLTEDPNYTISFNGTRELYSEMEDNGTYGNVTQPTCSEDLDMDARNEERDGIESSLKRTGLNVTSIPLHKGSMYYMKQAGSKDIKTVRETQQLEIHDELCCESDLQIRQKKFSDEGNFDKGCLVKQDLLNQPVQHMSVLQNVDKSSFDYENYKSKPAEKVTVVPPSSPIVLSQNTDSNESLSLLVRPDITQKNTLAYLSVPFNSVKKPGVIEIENDIDMDVEVSKTYVRNTRGDVREDSGGVQGQGVRDTEGNNQGSTADKQTNTEMKEVGAPYIGDSYTDGRINTGRIITNKVRDKERDNRRTTGGASHAEVVKKTNTGWVKAPKLTYSQGNEIFNKINRKREMACVGKKFTTAGGKKIRATTPNANHKNTDYQNFHGGLTSEKIYINEIKKKSYNKMREDGKTHNEMMRKVIDKAMKIISEKPSGTKPSYIDVDSTQLEHERLYRAEQNKTPQLSPREGHTGNDISPSIASFATFRSAFTEHFPVTRPSTQEQGPQDMFNGLKYPPLHLLINKGIIKPGRNILTANAKDREFRSSLTEDGNIESLGGELFQTPVKWLAAILGKPVPDVKKSQAYKQVHYRGRSLIRIIEEPTLVDNEDDSYQYESKERDNQCEDIAPVCLCSNSFNDKSSNKGSDSTGSLKIILHMSNIKLLDVTDFTKDNDLPENFWNDDFCKVKLCDELWKDIDNWN